MERNVGIEERKINLFDMFWAVCLKWRQILLCAVVTALLAGGFSYFKSVQNARQVADSAEKVSLDGLKLDDDSQNNVDVYLKYKQIYEKQFEYNMSAPLMQLDADNFYRNTLVYYVDNHFAVEYPIIDRHDDIDAIIASYKAGLGGKEFTDKLSKLVNKNGNEVDYAGELVDCSNEYGERDASDVGNNIMMISIYGSDENVCEELAQLIKDMIISRKATVIEQFGEHEITLLEDDCVGVANANLMRYQQENITRLAEYSVTLKNIESRLTEDELVYSKAYQRELNQGNKKGMITKLENDDIDAKETFVSKKMIFIGLLMGGGLAFFGSVLLYLLNNKLQLEDDYEKIYGVKLLADVVVDDDRRKKWFSFIDDFFLKLRHMNKHYFAEREAISMAAAGIKIGARKLDIFKVYITGSTVGQKEKIVVEQLEKELEQSGIELVIGKSMLYDAEALEKSAEIGCVVLVERAGTSFYSEIEKEIEICLHEGIELLGTIVIG